MIEILKLALVKRKIDVQCLEIKDAYASGKLMKQEVILKEGIDKEMAKKIVAHVKDAKLKVQAAIQGEQVRITGKKRETCRKRLPPARQGIRPAAAIQQLPRLINIGEPLGVIGVRRPQEQCRNDCALMG